MKITEQQLRRMVLRECSKLKKQDILKETMDTPDYNWLEELQVGLEKLSPQEKDKLLRMVADLYHDGNLQDAAYTLQQSMPRKTRSLPGMVSRQFSSIDANLSPEELASMEALGESKLHKMNLIDWFK